MTNQKRLSSAIAEWQNKRKLTNAQAAAEIGVPLRTYGDWKGGEHAPRGYARKKLSEWLSNQQPS